jgi:hypothetical protein
VQRLRAERERVIGRRNAKVLPENRCSSQRGSRPAAGSTGLAAGTHPLLQLGVRTGALLALLVVLELWLVHLTRLPEASYGRPVLVVELARRLLSLRPGAVLTLVVIGLGTGAAFRARSLGPRWSDFEQAHRLRGLIVLVAAVLAWVYATYPYNFYFDQAYDFDRLFLLAMVPLVFWRPVVLFPFLLVLFPTLWQFSHPIGGFSPAAPMLLLRVLLLFAAYWLVRVVTGRAHAADFLFLLCCLIAAHYWVSGFGKLQLGWLTRDRIGWLLPATYANGWLGFLEPEAISALTRTLLALNWPMKVGTLLIECGALIALWRRGGLRTLLVAWIGLHAGIFLLTGILFWMWMLLDAAVLVLFFGRRAPELPIFTRPHFVLSLLLIGGGALWFRPQKLAWLDSRVSYAYRVEGVGESGRSYALSPRFFSPYDYQLTLGNFGYLTPAPHLAITWGATYQPELVAALEHATSAERVLALEARMGRDVFHVERSAIFDHFVQRFVGGWNQRGHGGRWWTPLQAPPLLWTFTRGPSPTAADPIARVVVHQVTTLFDDRRYLEIRERTVRVITLESEEEPRAPPGSGRD